MTAEHSLSSASDVTTSDDKTKKAPGAFLTISEVAEELDVQQHVLRFWETKFTQVKPLKRGGGRRYYRPEDVALLKEIHKLLYTDKYTIKGVQKLLKGQSKMQIVQNSASNQQDSSAAPAASNDSNRQVAGSGSTSVRTASSTMSNTEREVLTQMLDDLKTIRKMMDR